MEPSAISLGPGPRAKCIVVVSHPIVCEQEPGESRGHVVIDWKEHPGDCPRAKEGQLRVRGADHKHHSKETMKEDRGG